MFDTSAMILGIAAAARMENQAAARRLRGVAELFEARRAQHEEAENWAVDTWAEVGGEIAAALRISVGKAGGYINDGLAMRRLPMVAELFAAGDIDAATFRTVVYRTELITRDVLIAEVDKLVARGIAGSPSMTQGRLIRLIDSLVMSWDPEAVRRTREREQDRDFRISDFTDGTADVSGRLFATDAQVLDQRLDAMAAAVCDADPRTLAQKRADALGALATGAQRLACTCGNSECASGATTPAPVVIHVVAEQSTLEGRDDKPALLMGADALIPADLLRDIAQAAKLRPLVAPKDCREERGYRPSRALADFIRSRDLTCRAPGCDRPALHCDIDHTVPYGAGGRTHASNLKALCRLHHLAKTFWGWKDTQLPDGTVIWTLPDGATYVTMPGSALLFPTLCAPTGEVSPREGEGESDGDRSVMMPRRRRTRAMDRAHRIATERSHNLRLLTLAGTPPRPGDEPPPF